MRSTATLSELRARVLTLRARVESYSGGDRPPAPPARLLRELRDAERDLQDAIESPLWPVEYRAVLICVEHTDDGNVALLEDVATHRDIRMPISAEQAGMWLRERHAEFRVTVTPQPRRAP